MQLRSATVAAAAPPAPSYAVHRQRALASAFPTAVGFIVVLTLVYAVADLLHAPSRAQAVGFAMELAVPVPARGRGRGRRGPGAGALALAPDPGFSAVRAGRLILPATTESGTALFLSIKLLATAALFPWQARLQYVSAASTL